MPCQVSLTLLPGGVEDFPRDDWLQPIYNNSRFVFIHINVTKIFTCGENFNKFFFSGSVLKILFFSRLSFENIIFFKVQFWKYYFFPGSVLKILFFSRFSFENIFFSMFSFENIFFQVQFWKYIYFFSGSVFELISQQPWKHKAAATLINNHKL